MRAALPLPEVPTGISSELRAAATATRATRLRYRKAFGMAAAVTLLAGAAAGAVGLG